MKPKHLLHGTYDWKVKIAQYSHVVVIGNGEYWSWKSFTSILHVSNWKLCERIDLNAILHFNRSLTVTVQTKRGEWKSIIYVRVQFNRSELARWVRM